MKRYYTIIRIIFISLLIFNNLISQTDTWPVKVIDGGKFLDVKAITQAGDMLDVVAIDFEDGNHFMDVKVIMGDQILPVKLLISNEFYVPVKSIGPSGEIFDIKAITEEGTKLDIKGVGRSGNAIIIAAITENEKFLNIQAISPEGNMREVFGVKFGEENLEQEINSVKILAHVKAIPSPKINTSQLVWNVRAIDTDGNSLQVFALDKNDEEYDVRAVVKGGSYHMIDVKALVNRNEQPIKLFNQDGRIFLAAVSERGELLQVKAKTASGEYLDILGIRGAGKIFDIKAAGPSGARFAVKAISDDGDVYDIKGIKVKEADDEGEIVGFVKTNLFHAHVKALPTFQ